MQLTEQVAKHIREVFYGGNWTWVNLKDTLQGISREQALAKQGSFNTIATLTYHIGYYVTAILQVMRGQPLDASDKFSFTHPPLATEADWQAMQQKIFTEADELVLRVQAIPEARLWELFAEEKYGHIYRNLQGLVEHTHYHLGQIALLKKMQQGTEGV